MKATELMIGDWVQLDGTPQRVNYINLEDGERVATDKNYFAMPSECYNPIPITPEILEKNGFVLRDRKFGGRELYSGLYMYVLDNKRIVTTNLWKGKHGWIQEIHIERDAYCKMTGRVKMYVTQVHEVQRILRVCGLTDLADNFKVE